MAEDKVEKRKGWKKRKEAEKRKACERLSSCARFGVDTLSTLIVLACGRPFCALILMWTRHSARIVVIPSHFCHSVQRSGSVADSHATCSRCIGHSCVLRVGGGRREAGRYVYA
mmetsp:Transcript_16913/g.42466  ORF Transcript_16913/g.42466 Transcript_16913/m.42466 type:complete len:114 (+) Transcript_16913:1314-1655(+)